MSIPIALTPGGIEAVGYSNTYGGGYAERMRVTAGICMKVPNGLDAPPGRADGADGRGPARGEQVGDQAG